MSAWALCVASASAFVGPLHTRVRQPTCATSAVPATMRSIKIAKTNSWGDVESEVLGKLGLAAGADAEADDTDGHLEGVVDTLPVSPRVPRSGTQSWGRWSHEGESVELDLVLPEGSTAKELKCEVSRAGVLSIQRGDQTLGYARAARGPHRPVLGRRGAGGRKQAPMRRSAHAADRHKPSRDERRLHLRRIIQDPWRLVPRTRAKWCLWQGMTS